MDDERFKECMDAFTERYLLLKKHKIGHYEMAVRMASMFVSQASTILFDIQLRRPWGVEENPVIAKIKSIRAKIDEPSYTFGTLFNDVEAAEEAAKRKDKQ